MSVDRDKVYRDCEGDVWWFADDRWKCTVSPTYQFTVAEVEAGDTGYCRPWVELVPATDWAHFPVEIRNLNSLIYELDQEIVRLRGLLADRDDRIEDLGREKTNWETKQYERRTQDALLIAQLEETLKVYMDVRI